ncbi:hypothetical protein FXF52_29895 [Micromonospora sp. MP36]|nr:hypothetical protein FXF52_29895 [Micromonospora sp. MP36]
MGPKSHHSRIRTRTRSRPRAMASLRNLAVGALRLAGRTDITEATCLACRYMSRPFAILSLTHDLGRAAPIQLIPGRVAWEHDWP